MQKLLQFISFAICTLSIQASPTNIVNKKTGLNHNCQKGYHKNVKTNHCIKNEENCIKYDQTTNSCVECPTGSELTKHQDSGDYCIFTKDKASCFLENDCTNKSLETVATYAACCSGIILLVWFMARYASTTVIRSNYSENDK